MYRQDGQIDGRTDKGDHNIIRPLGHITIQELISCHGHFGQQSPEF